MVSTSLQEPLLQNGQDAVNQFPKMMKYCADQLKHDCKCKFGVLILAASAVGILYIRSEDGGFHSPDAAPMLDTSFKHWAPSKEAFRALAGCQVGWWLNIIIEIIPAVLQSLSPALLAVSGAVLGVSGSVFMSLVAEGVSGNGGYPEYIMVSIISQLL